MAARKKRPSRTKRTVKAKRRPKAQAKTKSALRSKAKRVAKPRRETPTPKAVRSVPARKRRATDVVDETSRESFPASDPPSWTPVTGEGR